VEPLCDEIVTAEVTRAETLNACCDGAYAVFSSVGIRHFKRKPTYETVDYQGNLNLLEAAEAAGAARFVFVSVYGGDVHRRISPLVDARERVVDRLKTSKMETVVLRPTGFFNDLGDYFTMAEKGKAWLIGTGETKINPIHGADLADEAALVLADPHPLPEIPIGGPDILTQREIAGLAFRILGKPPRFGRVSPGLIRAVAKIIFPFNKNAAALALMFSILGDADGTAPCFGTHHLEDHFKALAKLG
jgi:uncharacterized protein YbjT (DUF2867 family)